jgi:hypothetical protein
MGPSPFPILFFVHQILLQVPRDFCRNAGEILPRRVDDYIGDIPIDRQTLRQDLFDLRECAGPGE